ncbi:MAG: hypothetical protein JOZ54_01865 [Acidobacteria bacterium]|nr:hypothetical protein [Acidobacteriota bacterium]
MVAVNRTGLVRVTAAQLATALSVPVQAIFNAIARQRSGRLGSGTPIAWNPTAAKDALLFYGEKGDTIFSDSRVYRIEMGGRARR